MAKPTISVEWTICDEVEARTLDTQAFPQVTSEMQTTHRRQRRIWWATALAALFVVSVASVWLGQSAQAGLGQINTELNNTVEQELWTSPEKSGKSRQEYREYTVPGFVATDGFLLDGGGRPPAANVEIVRLYEDKASVRLWIEHDGEAYRQTRLYQRSADGWVQIAPEAEMLGAWQQLETDHLSIGYFALDADAVAGAAPQLEAYAAQLQTDLGLSAATAKKSVKKYLIVITPDQRLFRSERIEDEELRHHAIYLTSPALSLLPAQATESNVLVQWITLELFYPLLRERLDQYDKRECALRWLPLLSAMRLWAFWENNAPLTRELNEGKSYLAASMPNTLAALFQPGTACWLEEETTISDDQKVELTTVLDYIVVTYGREQLPRLVGALDEHASWDTLIPALFNVPLADFEEGWRAYVAEKQSE